MLYSEPLRGLSVCDRPKKYTPSLLCVAPLCFVVVRDANVIRFGLIVRTLIDNYFDL